jgi:hypothetical protein
VTAAAAAAAAAAATVGVGTSQEGGHVELELGETRVLAIASIEAVAPFPDRPNEGMFKLEVEFSPMASLHFEPGRSVCGACSVRGARYNLVLNAWQKGGGGGARGALQHPVLAACPCLCPCPLDILCVGGWWGQPLQRAGQRHHGGHAGGGARSAGRACGRHGARPLGWGGAWSDGCRARQLSAPSSATTHRTPHPHACFALVSCAPCNALPSRPSHKLCSFDLPRRRQESLCIAGGKLVWSLRVDCHVLDHGGNLVDACALATIAALLSFRRPVSATLAPPPRSTDENAPRSTDRNAPLLRPLRTGRHRLRRQRDRDTPDGGARAREHRVVGVGRGRGGTPLSPPSVPTLCGGGGGCGCCSSVSSLASPRPLQPPL